MGKSVCPAPVGVLPCMLHALPILSPALLASEAFTGLPAPLACWQLSLGMHSSSWCLLQPTKLTAKVPRSLLLLSCNLCPCDALDAEPLAGRSPFNCRKPHVTDVYRALQQTEHPAAAAAVLAAGPSQQSEYQQVQRQQPALIL